jgi:hypothetical protein
VNLPCYQEQSDVSVTDGDWSLSGAGAVPLRSWEVIGNTPLESFMATEEQRESKMKGEYHD